MASAPGLDQTAEHFMYGEGLGIVLTNALARVVSLCTPKTERPERDKVFQIYQRDGVGPRTLRVIMAVITGIFQVVLFPLTCAIGLLKPLVGCYKVYKVDRREFDAPCVTAAFSFLGLVACAVYVAAFAYGGLTLNQTIGIFLGAVSVSIAANVYTALTPHQPPPKKADNV